MAESSQVTSVPGFVINPNKPLRQQADEAEITSQENELARDVQALAVAEATYHRDQSFVDRVIDKWTPFNNSATKQRLRLVEPERRAVSIRQATVARLKAIAPRDIAPPLTNCVPDPARERLRAADMAKTILDQERDRYDGVPPPTVQQLRDQQPPIDVQGWPR